MLPRYPKAIQKLIETLKLLPSVGTKSAERFAFELLSWPEEKVNQFSRNLYSSYSEIQICQDCGCYIETDSTFEEGCMRCERRNQKQLCIVAYPKEVFSIEATGCYRGPFHVLGGLIAPLEGVSHEDLNIPKLLERVKKDAITDLLIAIDATVEGDATALYLKQELDKTLSEDSKPKIQRLAFGMPINSSLEYVDSATLAQAISSKQSF